MKKSIALFAAVLMIASFSNTVLAENNPVTTATPTSAGAKIVKALTLTQTAALNFGTMTIPTAAVDVVLSTINGRTATVAGNIVLLPQAPVAANAAYTVAGTTDATYVIALPADGVIKISTGTTTDDMFVNGFLARTASKGVDGLTGSLDGTNGNDTFTVGATLKLKLAQPFGTYTGTFPVTVAYN